MATRTPYADIRKYVTRRAQALLEIRRSHEASLCDCRDYILPDLGQSFSRDAISVAQNAGKRTDSKILNGTPTTAALTLAAGMQSGLTSPCRPWFKLVTPYSQLREVSSVRLWLDAVQRTMQNIMASSNIYNVFHDIYLHLGGFGTAAALLVEDDDYVVNGFMLDQGTYSLGTDRRGRVNVLHRSFAMTIAQMAEEFGKDALPSQLRAKLEPVASGISTREDDQLHNIDCLVEPNSDALVLPEVYGRPFRSIYWLRDITGTADEGGRDGVLAVRGYSGNPIVAPRWYVPHGVYGYGPGRRAIGDCIQLQTMEADKLKALRKLVDPPLAVPDSLKGITLNTFPGGTTYYPSMGGMAGRPGVGPLYEVRPALQDIQVVISQVELRIRQAFFNDLFMMLSGFEGNPQMTAREVIERHEEKLIMIGPVLERLHLELLDATVDRVFQIMADRSMLPPAPQALLGMPLKVEYISILAVAQRMVGMQSISQFVQFVGNIAGIRPDVMDKVDTDQLVDEAGDAMGVPAGVIVDDDMVVAIRQNRQQQLQQQQQAQMAMAVTQGARNLGQANTQPGSALGDAKQVLQQ